MSGIMRTVTENLKELAENIKSLLIELIQNHSEIYRWNTPSYNDSVVFVGGDYAWRELKTEGKRLQSKILHEYRHLYDIFKTMLRGQPKDELYTFHNHHKAIIEIIEQNKHLYNQDKTDQLNQAIFAIEGFISLLDHLYDSGESDFILIPDTNALLYNPALESWTYDDIPMFTLALTPIVLSELDSLKINHKNQDVREKANRLIRQIKEYRRRGRLLNGVPLKKGTSILKTFAKEPDMANNLPWLDKNNKDDQLLAYLIEIMRYHVRSFVLLVTRDINLQNKVEFARLLFLEPPELN
jgi:hypothetical protein